MGIKKMLAKLFIEDVEENSDEVEEIKEQVPIAKKIETPEVKRANEEVNSVNNNIYEEITGRKNSFFDEEASQEEEEEAPVLPKREERYFPMNFDDEDFEVESENDREVVSRSERNQLNNFEVEEEEENLPVINTFEEEEKEEEKPLYNHRMEKTYSSLEEFREDNHPLSLSYEYNEPKKSGGFKPSPVISPVYGILDKNYKKEDVPIKKEIRLSVTSKKVDLDYVREKAYGEIADDISDSINEGEKEIEQIPEENTNNAVKNEENDLLYDLSEEEPSVKEVTVGDAEEYFNDLGLEYNVDYKVEEKRTHKKEEKTEEENLEDTSSDLFDLINSMYEDKE